MVPADIDDGGVGKAGQVGQVGCGEISGGENQIHIGKLPPDLLTPQKAGGFIRDGQYFHGAVLTFCSS